MQFQGQLDIFIQAVYYWGSILETKELATLTGRVPELCGWAPWLGSVSRPCPGLVLLLSSVAGLCSVSRPCPLWLGSVSGPCPPLVLSWPRPELCGWMPTKNH